MLRVLLYVFIISSTSNVDKTLSQFSGPIIVFWLAIGIRGSTHYIFEDFLRYFAYKSKTIILCNLLRKQPEPLQFRTFNIQLNQKF